MSKWFIIVMAALLLLLFVLSCERTTISEPTLTLEGISELAEIPGEYGALEGVTTDAEYPHWAQLWFEDSVGTIRIVRVNWMEKTMLDDVIVIIRSNQMINDVEEVEK